MRLLRHGPSTQAAKLEGMAGRQSLARFALIGSSLSLYLVWATRASSLCWPRPAMHRLPATRASKAPGICSPTGDLNCFLPPFKQWRCLQGAASNMKAAMQRHPAACWHHGSPRHTRAHRQTKSSPPAALFVHRQPHPSTPRPWLPVSPALTAPDLSGWNAEETPAKPQAGRPPPLRGPRV